MSSPTKETEEPSSTSEVGEKVESSQEKAVENEAATTTSSEEPRPPAKRRMSSTVIEISDTESDDSDVCAVTSYQASADEVKRIRGEDYSSSSTSSSDYSSGDESPWEDDSVVVPDERPHSKVLQSSLNPRANRMDEPKMNTTLKSQEIIERLKLHWKEYKDHSSEEITLTSEPFRLCLLHDFLENAEIINNIVDDMNTLDWTRKKMDLYEFHQTVDLANLTWQRGIKGIYELLKTEVMQWVSEVTGLELTSVSASCSLYGPGDHLLPHDDLLGDRRVAFILYIAPWRPHHVSYSRHATENGAGDVNDVDQVDVEERGWSGHMGGALELFSLDAGGRPAHVVRSVCPQNNMLAFFKVGPETFHQVSEVLSLELPRLSINGWFHGPGVGVGETAPSPSPSPSPALTPEEPPPPPTHPLLDPHNHVVVMREWVSPSYMTPRSRAAIQTHMERHSEASLGCFLLPQQADRVVEALDRPEVPWEAAGPADRCRYWRVPAEWLRSQAECDAARGLAELLTSQAFCRLLHDCTDLTIAKYCNFSVQKWTAACYTLLPPREEYAECRLEAVLYVGVPRRALAGGHTTFAAPDTDDTEGALVTLPATHNALGLVYCDAGAAAFTKYLSRITLGPKDRFYRIVCTYKEA